MRRVFGFFIGATIGGLVGATVALLFAPAWERKYAHKSLTAPRPLRTKFDRQQIRNESNYRNVWKSCALPRRKLSSESKKNGI